MARSATVAPSGTAWQGVAAPGSGTADIINNQLSVFTSSGTANTADDDYDTFWSTSSGNWIAFDLTSADSQPSRVAVSQICSVDTGLTIASEFQGCCPAWSGRPYLSAYTVQGNAASGGGSAPTSGWVTLAAVSGSSWLSRQHTVDVSAYNWVRLNVTGAPNGVAHHIDVSDHSGGDNLDGWLFLGDSITNRYATHGGNTWTDQIDTATGRRPVQLNYAMDCTKASDAVVWIEDLLDTFTGKYVCLNFGANDGFGGNPSTSAFDSNMRSLVASVVAYGMTPVIPQITWPNNGGSWETGIIALNSVIDGVVADTAAIAGPDLYTLTDGQSSWFDGAGDVHPNSTGATQIYAAWSTMMQGLY